MTLYIPIRYLNNSNLTLDSQKFSIPSNFYQNSISKSLPIIFSNVAFSQPVTRNFEFLFLIMFIVVAYAYRAEFCTLAHLKSTQLQRQLWDRHRTLSIHVSIHTIEPVRELNIIDFRMSLSNPRQSFIL
jgi:hypothetical protein